MATVIPSTAIESPFASVGIAPSAPYVVRIDGRLIGEVFTEVGGAWHYRPASDMAGIYGAWDSPDEARAALLYDEILNRK